MLPIMTREASARRRLPAAALFVALAISPTSRAAPSTDWTLADRVVAFATLFDAVRYYHPSDEVAQVTDWNRVAVVAAERVVGPTAPEDLGLALERAFAKLAPTLRVMRDGESFSPPRELLATPGNPTEIVLWRHFGPGIPQRRKVNYLSERLGSASPARFGTVAQSLPAATLRGRRFRFAARVRLRKETRDTARGSRAQLFVRVDRAGGQRGFFDAMEDRPIRSTTWTRYALEGVIDADAEKIVVGAVLFGEGSVLLDDVELEVAPAARSDLELANANFDEGLVEQQPPGWTFPYEAIREGYRFVHRRDAICYRGDCAEILADPAARLEFSPPSRATVFSLGAGLTALLPTRLFRDARGTLPAAKAPPAMTEPTPSRLAERTAALATLWGAYAHFQPYLGSEQADWSEALRKAANDADFHGDDAAFSRTLERLLAASGDLAAEVWAPHETQPHQPPIEWRWVEESLVLTHAPAGTGLRAGGVVTAIDGQPTRVRLEEMESRTAGSTSAARRATALARLLNGPKDSELQLEVERGEGTREVRLVRDQPAEVFVAAERPAIEELAPGTWYLDLRRLSDEDLAAAILRLERAKRIVADARGFLSTGTELLAHLTERELPSANWQMMVTTEPFQRDARPVSTFWTVLPKAPRLRGRVAFLIDERASAYSETVLGIVEAFRLGELVGSPTAGNNGNVAFVDLPGGYRASFTGLHVLKHDGSPLQGIGILPTREVVPTRAGFAAGRDEVLAAAVAALQ